MLMPTMVHWHQAFSTFMKSPRKHFLTIGLWIPLAGVAYQPLLWLTFRVLIVAHSPTSSSFIQSQVFSVSPRRSPIALCSLRIWIRVIWSLGSQILRTLVLLESWWSVYETILVMCSWLLLIMGSASMVGRITEDWVHMELRSLASELMRSHCVSPTV